MDEQNTAPEAQESAEDKLYRMLGGDSAADVSEERNEGKPPAEAAKEAAEAAQEEPEAPAEEAADVVQTFKVKVNGEEVEVSLDELTKGYSRQSDYTRKAQEVAAERQKLEAQAKQVQEFVQQAQGREEALRNALGLQLQEQAKTNWTELLESNPAEYLKQRHLFEERQAAFQRSQQESQRLAQQAREQAAQTYHQRLQQESERLLEKLPEWQDADKATAEKAKLAAYLKAQNLGEDAIGNVVHYADLTVMARKAMLFDEQQSKAAEAVKKVAALPPKTLRPGTADIAATDGRTRAMKALARSGSTDAAADVLAAMFSR